MDILTENIPDNYNNVRNRTFSPKIQYSRASSLFSTKFSVAYHERMELNNSINLVFPCGDDTIINIQLLYDPNAPIEPDLWDSNFHPISLHSSIKYLASDSKNIKDLLNFIAKYITNKQINPAKSNVMNLFLRVGNKNNSCIRETQENLIEFLRQSSLPYIL